MPHCGNLGAVADAAMDLVDLAQQPLGDRVELRAGDRTAVLRLAQPLQRLAQRRDILRDIVAFRRR